MLPLMCCMSLDYSSKEEEEGSAHSRGPRRSRRTSSSCARSSSRVAAIRPPVPARLEGRDGCPARTDRSFPSDAALPSCRSRDARATARPSSPLSRRRPTTGHPRDPCPESGLHLPLLMSCIILRSKPLPLPKPPPPPPPDLTFVCGDGSISQGAMEAGLSSFRFQLISLLVGPVVAS